MRDLALFFHLLGALLLSAGIVLAGVAFEAARRRERPAEMALLLALTRIGVLLAGIGALLLLSFGLWLMHLERIGSGAGWLIWSSGLYLSALVLGGLGGQRPKQARRLATRLADEDAPVTAELHALLDDPFSLAANYISAISVVAILALMIFKP